MAALAWKSYHALVLVIAYLAADARLSLAFSASSPTPATSRVKDTKVAVDGTATVSVTPPQHAVSDDVTLTKYMNLPVEQYVLIPMPLGSSLGVSSEHRDQSLSAWTEFELIVPTITFFKLSLQPIVYASVQPQKKQVVISSNTCILRGSPFIEKVQLNDRFDFSVNTTLTWEDSLSSSNGQSLGDDPTAGCSITANTCINVDVDVPRPFSSLPKAILEKTGNAAMRLSLKYIQANFVDNLAKDYEKWANDAEYRDYRASLSEKHVEEGEAGHEESSLLAGFAELAQ